MTIEQDLRTLDQIAAVCRPKDADALRRVADYVSACEGQANAIRLAFPLFDEEGLNEVDHAAEWVLLQERKRLHELLPSPPPAGMQLVPDVITDKQKQEIRESLAEALGNAMDCTRVWSAWSYDTMSADDFIEVADQDDRMDEITNAAIDSVLKAARGESALPAVDPVCEGGAE